MIRLRLKLIKRPNLRGFAAGLTQQPPGQFSRILLPAFQEKFDFHKHYDAERRHFEQHPLSAPSNFNFARDVIERWAAFEEHYGKPNLALWWCDDLGNERKFTFRELVQESKRLANGLTMVAGLKQGDRVIVVLPKLYHWYILALACTRAGITMCPGTGMLSERDLQHRIEMSGAKAVICDEDRAARMEGAIKAISPEKCTVHSKILVPVTRDRVSRPGWLSYDQDLLQRGVPHEHKCVENRRDDAMFIYFTSGTTGLPKMVNIPRQMALGHYTSSRYLLNSRPGDLCWSFSDPGWVKILYMQYFGPFLGAGTVFCWNNTNAAVKAVEMLNILKKYPINTFCGAPTLYRMFMLERLPTPDEVPHLRNCMSAGEPNNPEVIEKWTKATGVRIREGYGQSETTILACNMPGMPFRAGSMGLPVPGANLRIVDENCRELPPNQEGQLAIKLDSDPARRPLGLFKEYINAKEAMDKAFPIGQTGYYITGDKCYMDKDGYIYFVGRADDVIIMAGYRIGPFEVESALIEHPAVAESAVVSSPDELKGEVVKAFVVLKPNVATDASIDRDALAAELQEHCKKVTAPYKYPRKIEFLDALPKTVSGKTRRVELRQREWAGHAKPRA